MNPKVSIIVPCYNVENYIEECIQSILKNKYEPKELILINDGSTDGTQLVLNKFKNNLYVKVLEQKNSGVSACRNRGLQEAKGEFILFVDSDDWISTDCIEKLVNKAVDSEADLILCGYWVAVEERDGSTKFEKKKVPRFCCKNKEDIFDTLFKDLMGISNWDIYRWNHGGKLNSEDKIDGYSCGRLYRKSIIEKYCIRFDTNLYMKEDTIFNLEYLSYIETTSFVNDNLYFYRIRRDRSNVVARLNENWEHIYRNKLGLLKARTKIRNINMEINQRDVLDMYCGSIVLSAIEVALCCAKEKSLGRKAYKKYMDAGVMESVKCLNLQLANIKFNIILFLLKMKGTSFLYIFIKVLVKIGLDNKLMNI